MLNVKQWGTDFPLDPVGAAMDCFYKPDDSLNFIYSSVARGSHPTPVALNAPLPQSDVFALC